MRSPSLPSWLQLAVRRDRRVPGAAYRRLRADDLPHLHQAVRSGRFAADGRSGSGQEVEAGGRRRSHQRAPARRASRRAGDRARMCRFPTTCASCRSRRTISLGPTRPGMPTNRRTVAIPKHVLDGVDRKPLRGTAEADGAQTEAGPQVADGSQSQGTDDNPRSRWR